MIEFLLNSIESGVNFAGADMGTAFVPLMKLLTLATMGLILAHPTTKIIPKETFRLLSKLVFALFLPCLIFTELGENMTLDNIRQWWFIPVNFFLSTVIGLILGVVVVTICRPPPQFNRFTIIMTAFGNTGNIPLAIVGSVCHSKDNPFGSNCKSRGVAYIAFYHWVSVILVYTFVYHMMEPPIQFYEIVEEGTEAEDSTENHDVSKPLLVVAEWPGIEDKETEHSKTPFIARVFNNISSLSQTTLPDLDLHGECSANNPMSIRCLAEPRVVRRIRIVAEQTPIQHVLQPPTIASLLAITIGLIPNLKAFFFGYEAPLSFITDSLDILSRAVVPSVMLILGGMLAEGPSESGLGLRTAVGVMLARLVVLPLVGVGVVGLAAKMGFLVKGDAMYVFVLLLQYTTPSAILLGAIASLRGYAVKEASALLFWQHLFALLSLTFYVIFYFKILSYF